MGTAQALKAKVSHIDAGAEPGARGLHHMTMMGEQDGLPLASKFRHHINGMSCSFVIKTGQQVITDKGRGIGAALAQQRKAQGEEKLVAGSLAHRFSGQPGAIAPRTLEKGLPIVVQIHDHA